MINGAFHDLQQYNQPSSVFLFPFLFPPSLFIIFHLANQRLHNRLSPPVRPRRADTTTVSDHVYFPFADQCDQWFIELLIGSRFPRYSAFFESALYEELVKTHEFHKFWLSLRNRKALASHGEGSA